MIVEYIRYKIDPSRNGEFDEAYRRAGELLDALLHCQRWEVARCVDEPEKRIVRIEWDSAEGHLQGFRQSADFKPFLVATGPFYNDIEEITHYQVTATRRAFGDEGPLSGLAPGGLIRPSRLRRVLDFFVYSRDAPGTAALRDDDQLLEEHWLYMDGFAESMIARGPTLATNRQTATGSLHVLRLPSVEAAHEFVVREPNNRRGLYAEHSVWRFENLLGRTMWEFSRAADEPRFLIIARSHPSQKARGSGRPAPPDSLSVELRERLILYGALATLDDARLIGVALAVQARDREAVTTLLDEERFGLDVFPHIETHDWEFGGRR
jgi:uncharacterized protein